MKGDHDGSRIRWIIIFAWKFVVFVTLGALIYLNKDSAPPCSNSSSSPRFRRESNEQMEPVTMIVNEYLQTTLPNNSSSITPVPLIANNNSMSNSTSSMNTTDGGGLYPPELFNMEQKRNGAVILYCICLLYMFCALAIVCDEFFVPALEVITEKMDISEDVAGATMMAAGGSAPELFTSVIGVFFAESDVGIGTIVGSAVFNVLFVIGMCAIFSKEVLQLTWWPLFRDCSFYIVSLLTLIWAFYDSQITWYESLCLLICYFAYVGFMKYNQHVEAWVKSKISNGDPVSVKVYPLPDGQAVNDKPEKPIPIQNQPVEDLNQQQSVDSGGSQSKSANFHPTGWKIAAQRVTVLKQDQCESVSTSLGVNGAEMSQNAKMTTFAQVSDTVLREQRSQKYHRCRNRCSIRVLLKVNSKSVNRGMERTQTMDEIGTNGVNKVRRSRSWQPMSKHASLAQSHERTFSIEREPVSTVNNPVQTANGTGSMGPSGGGAVSALTQRDSKDQINMPPITEESATGPNSSNNSLDKATIPTTGDQLTNQSSEEEEDGADFLDMSWPQGDCKKQAMYLFLIGITGPLYLLLPDVRRPGREKYVIVTFFGSIFAIAVYSYIMVWMADVIGQVAKIPIEIMGLTFLAAGTSVPDLITSVIVAKKGLGDMAVSSSIGSNIFDVTVGLPFPWILKSWITNGQPIQVESTGMFCSIALLFMMLVFVFISIALYKWKMTKGLGLIMFCLYGVFVIVTLLINEDKIPCPFNTL